VLTQIKLHKYWFELIAEFTSADLTMVSDRLIAINGIAEGIEEEPDGELLQARQKFWSYWNTILF